MRVRWSEREARAVLTSWRKSGQSLEEFAKSRALVPQRLRWWRKKIEGGSTGRTVPREGRAACRALAGSRERPSGEARRALRGVPAQRPRRRGRPRLRRGSLRARRQPADRFPFQYTRGRSRRHTSFRTPRMAYVWPARSRPHPSQTISYQDSGAPQEGQDQRCFWLVSHASTPSRWMVARLAAASPTWGRSFDMDCQRRNGLQGYSAHSLQRASPRLVAQSRKPHTRQPA